MMVEEERDTKQEVTEAFLKIHKMKIDAPSSVRSGSGTSAGLIKNQMSPMNFGPDESDESSKGSMMPSESCTSFIPE